MNQRLPKILILSRGVWDDTKGISSTLTNFFEDYDSERIAHIYIESFSPNTSCCHIFYQISEASLIHRLFNRKTRTGYVIDTHIEQHSAVSPSIVKEEKRLMSFVRRHRSVAFSWARELLWAFNGWKSIEMEDFINSFNPDVIWLDGSPLPLMNRLYRFVLGIAKKPAVIFMQDDIYAKNDRPAGLLRRLYHHYLQRTIDRVIPYCKGMFVISPKMKKEYDELFGFDSVFIAKSFRFHPKEDNATLVHTPLRLLYMGQLIYGRISTMIMLSRALEEVNRHGIRLELSIYTNSVISSEDKNSLLKGGHVVLKEAVPYSDVSSVIGENDVVVFVESFDPGLKHVARLSLSTKISDYLSSGKCVFAIGPSDIAPIEYLSAEHAAIVASSEEDILPCLYELSKRSVIDKYAANAIQCARKNHDREKMDEAIYGKLLEMAS